MSQKNTIPSPLTGSISRRGLLRLAGLGTAAAAAGPVLAACGGGSSSASGTTNAGATTLSIQLSWVADTEFAPLYLADTNGYYKQNNVAIKLTPGGSDIGAIEGIVAAGKADIGIATDITTVVAAIADGNPLVCVGALYQSNLNMLMSKWDAPITTVAGLKGKRLGGPQGIQTKFDAIFKLNGLEPDYKFIPTGYGPDSLLNGDVDVLAGFVTDEVLSYKKETGHMPGLLSFTDAGLPAYTLPIFTTTSKLASERAAIKGFLGATLRGFADDVADPTAGPKLAVSTYGKAAGLDQASEIEHNAAYLPLASSDATKTHGYMWIDTDYLSGPIYKGMVASGMKTIDAAKAVDMSLLTELHTGS
ncbi:putative NMT1/THI5 like protein [Frankia canadensis]|uniref:Putative NMT1/THI5 like protein n=1 Tax=Frankia canadensis TaxID=1836972 RepID=A0A2I2KID7_9ACTN|nr:ABC transporter substrate-binding protein [Frankia canadensis]SNQ45423.1 putative NMT1/THI5 like protein [Frankia canadensis]SOU52713.1 putative NMT1/THI5 like protein [Frankia canadensis]